MRKWERELRATIQDLGLSIDSMTTTGGTHHKLVVRHPDGRTMKVIAANTPSDRRGLLNLRSEIRRHFGLEKKHEGESRPVVRDRDLLRK